MDRAQGLSVNTIILTAIALLVLVVLVFIMTGRTALFSIGVHESTDCLTFCEGMGFSSYRDLSEMECQELRQAEPNRYGFAKAEFTELKAGCCCAK